MAMKTKTTLFLIAFLVLSGQCFSQEKIHTCINEKGEKLFSVKAKSVGYFYDGMAQVQKTVLENNNSSYRIGFVDEHGKQVITPKYEKAHQFSAGVTWVKEPGADGYYLINKKGERLTQGTWKKVGYFIEGFSSVYDDQDRMGFVNRKGELVIPCNYLGGAFSEGLVCIMPSNSAVEKYGFMDTTGKLVIPYQYAQPGTSHFANGECRVMINGVTCLINHQGDVVFKPTLTKNTQGFYGGLSASYTNYNTRGDWGYYNRKNEWVIKPQYDNGGNFKGGLAVVEKGGKEGIIDSTGKIILPIQYASIYANTVDDGYFGVEMVSNGDKEYINAQGKPFTSVPVKYLFSAHGHRLLPYCDKNDQYGYLNQDGSVFIPSQFERTESFYEGKSWLTGDASSLKTAAGVKEDAFVKEYTVGEKIKSQKNGKGEYYPGTIKQIGEYYYLIAFDNGDQEWVVFDSIKR